jgi:hypothetical protein
MTQSSLESFLARIYVDEVTRNRFLANPRAEATLAGLQQNEIESVVNIDRVGLELFVRTLERKREHKSKHS